jgi:hypothetical protein
MSQGAFDSGELRAADSDRERVVEDLREHTAEGRLTMDEFEERMQAAYAARTFNDLAKLTKDLPERTGDGRRTTPQPDADGPVDLADLRPPAPRHGVVLGRWRRFASFSVLLVGLWLITGGVHRHLAGFWPIWPIGVMAWILLAKTLRGDGGPGPRSRHQRHLEMRERQRERRREMRERRGEWHRAAHHRQREWAERIAQRQAERIQGVVEDQLRRHGDRLQERVEDMARRISARSARYGSRRVRYDTHRD